MQIGARFFVGKKEYLFLQIFKDTDGENIACLGLDFELPDDITIYKITLPVRNFKLSESTAQKTFDAIQNLNKKEQLKLFRLLSNDLNKFFKKL